jgi:murein DD-endopeptidase MepM/ murein hydrolase activator NlpD
VPAKTSHWLLLALLGFFPAIATLPASAAEGDVFPRGKHWCATTHPNHGTPQGFGPALDMGSPTDYRWPILAPEDGRVRVYSRVGESNGWGNSIMWISRDGRERIHMAHLDTIDARGRVNAGDMIGRVGDTGQSTTPHLHASRRLSGRPAPLVLGGRPLQAGDCRVSKGAAPSAPKPEPRPGWLRRDARSSLSGEQLGTGSGGFIRQEPGTGHALAGLAPRP